MHLVLVCILDSTITKLRNRDRYRANLRGVAKDRIEEDGNSVGLEESIVMGFEHLQAFGLGIDTPPAPHIGRGTWLGTGTHSAWHCFCIE